MISYDLKLKILYEYVTNKKHLKFIANENGISLDKAIAILQEFKEQQPLELTRIIAEYFKGETKYNSRVKMFVKRGEKKQEEKKYKKDNETKQEESKSINVTDDLNYRVLYEYVTTHKHLRIIASENGIAFEEAIKILQEFKDIQPQEVMDLIDDYYKNPTKYNLRISMLIRKEKKQRKNPTIEEQYGEIIYKLRKERAMTYRQIRDLLEEQYGLKTSTNIVYTVGKNVFYKKGEEDPLLKKEDSNVLDYMIYTLREYGLSYENIATILNKRGKKISAQSVRTRCISVYESKNESVPQIRHRVTKLDEDIYYLKGKGLDNEEIARRLNVEGLSDEDIDMRYIKMEKYNKMNFVKVVVDFITERKLSVTDMEKIAEHFGIDLEDTLKSLEKEER